MFLVCGAVVCVFLWGKIVALYHCLRDVVKLNISDYSYWKSCCQKNGFITCENKVFCDVVVLF